MDAGEEEKNFRPNFTEKLSQYSNNEVTDSHHKPCTVAIVSGMNGEMVKNEVKMTKAHYEAAIKSIEQGDNIVNFTINENHHVLNSTGQGWLYKMGYGYHTVLGAIVKPKDK